MGFVCGCRLSAETQNVLLNCCLLQTTFRIWPHRITAKPVNWPLLHHHPLPPRCLAPSPTLYFALWHSFIRPSGVVLVPVAVLVSFFCAYLRLTSHLLCLSFSHSRLALLSAMRGQLYGPLSVQAKPLKWAVKGLLILLIPHAEIEYSFGAQRSQQQSNWSNWSKCWTVHSTLTSPTHVAVELPARNCVLCMLCECVSSLAAHLAMPWIHCKRLNNSG